MFIASTLHPPPPSPALKVNANPPLAPRSQATSSAPRMASRQPLPAAPTSAPSGTLTTMPREQALSKQQPHQKQHQQPPPSSSSPQPLSNPQPRLAVPSTRTRTNVASSSSSISSTSLDGHSLFSDMLSDVSTRLTSPLQSDSGHAKNKQKAPVKRKDYAYTDEDWANDVRWLVPPKEKEQETSKSTITPISLPARKKSTSKHPAAPKAKQPQQPSYFTATNGMPMPNAPAVHPKPHKGHNQSIMMSMAALMEEEEEEGEYSSAPSSNASPARTPRPSIVKGHAPLPRSSVLPGPSRLRVSSSPSSSTPELVPQPRSSVGKPSKPPMKRRRSRSLEHPPPSISSSHTSGTVKSYKAELQALPRPSGDLPSSGTQGYTSLVLPRAIPTRSATMPIPLPNIGIGLGDGKIDLTKAGLAQTTMASVEVVRGLGENVKKGGAGALMRVFSRRRATISNPPNGKGRSASVDLTTDVKGKGKAREKATILGFTSHRPPPSQVPSGSVVVQVWAVGVDGVDGRLVGVRVDPVSFQSPQEEPKTEKEKEAGERPKPKRTLSLRSTLGRSPSTKESSAPSSTASHTLEPKKAEVGFIPGRSFVGRVMECGWEVREEVVRRGDWVVGLLDVRKSGALTEFITVDRHRIHRVPHPRMDPVPPIKMPHPLQTSRPTLAVKTSSISTPTIKPSSQVLTLEELALLPLCGVPAYRAVRTFIFAFSSVREEGGSVAGSASLPAEHDSRRRRALVLRGHDGAGAMAVQMLVQRGWRISVHAPFPFPSSHPDSSSGAAERYMTTIEDRARSWGAEEVVFDDGGLDGRWPIVRAIDNLRADGDAFDAVLDTVGGREVREAAERLLRSSSCGGLETPKTPGGFSLLDGKGSTKGKKKEKAMGQFTTLYGDVPERPIPNAGDHFRAGLRSLRFASSGANDIPKVNDERQQDAPPTPTATGKGKVGYALVSVAQDVDWEGEDVRGTIATVLRMALDGDVRPWVGPTPPLLLRTEDEDKPEKARVVAFETAPDVFVDDGRLCDGGTVVVRVAAA